MEAWREVVVVTRRGVLKVLGGLSFAAFVAPLLSREARGQGNLGALQPEEKVEATLKRLFGDRPIKDGGTLINLEAPLIAENGAVVPVTVEVKSPMTPTSYVKNIYFISDKNRRPMNAKFSFTPGAAQSSIGTNLRLGETTDVRAIAELSDGTLLMARSEVKVTVGGCGG